MVEVKGDTETTILVRRGVDHGPIFHATQNGKTLISRKLAPLVESLSPRPSIDLEAFATWLRPPLPEDLERTPYRGVFRVPAHHQVTLNPNGKRTLVELPTNLASLDAIEPAEAVRELSVRFVAAVRRHIENRQRVAVFVSGGVDSSAVLAATVALARGASRPEVEAIAIHFGAEGDDRPYLRDLTKALGLVPIRMSPSSGGPHVLETLVVDGTPLGSAPMALRAALLKRARESGAEVALTGDGGDFLLDGAPEHPLAVSGGLECRTPGGPLACVLARSGVDQAWSFIVARCTWSPTRLRNLRFARH